MFELSVSDYNYNPGSDGVISIQMTYIHSLTLLGIPG